MNGMGYLIPIVVLVLVFGTKGFREVKDYLLKKEKIKADAMIRAEALRLKNEMELEKLIRNDQKDQQPKVGADAQENTQYRERGTSDRLRY